MGWKADQREFRKAIEDGAEPTVATALFRRWSVQDPDSPRSVRQFLFRSSKEVDGWVEHLGIYPPNPSPDSAPYAVVTLAVHDARQLPQAGEIVLIADPSDAKMMAVLSPENDALWPLHPPRGAREIDPSWNESV